MFRLDELNSVVVGENVAKKLGIKPGDVILATGVLTDHYLELHVKGVFTSQSAMDDEILAPLYMGQWLRGRDYGHVTLIRFKIDRNVITPSMIWEEIAKEASEPSPSPSQEPQPLSLTPRIIARFRIEDLGVEEAYDFMRGYMERYGLTRESLLVLSAMVFLFSSASIAAASKTVLAQHKGEIGVLRSLGASRKLLKGDLLAKLLLWSAASAAGFAAAVVLLNAIREGGYLQILSHTLPIQIDPLVMTINFIIALFLVAISILRSELP
ncbi:MAG: FtsX-like permease family protein [Candidatus Methanomethyliales bacterium]|nr:FtsX-like permease family protein [Candidatus Methanomethylicales archaeon]